jgi:hypothetical protein
MYDINPLGPMLHLRQLEQQVRPNLREERPNRQTFSIVCLGLAVAVYLHRLATQLLNRRGLQADAGPSKSI